MSATASFDFAPLLPAGLPAPAARWTGLAKYSFVGGNNDPDEVPVDGLIEAVNAVLKREGKTLATYGLASGPQGYRPLREFLAAKLKRDAGIACSADDIMIVSGSLQALDLVNQTLLARGDTVFVEQETYQGAKSLGPGKGYESPPAAPTGWGSQQYKPSEREGRRYYEPLPWPR